MNGGIVKMGRAFKEIILIVGLLTKSASTEGMDNRVNGPSTHCFGVRVFDIFEVYFSCACSLGSPGELCI